MRGLLKKCAKDKCLTAQRPVKRKVVFRKYATFAAVMWTNRRNKHGSLFALVPASLGLLLSIPLRIGVRVWFGISIPIVPTRELVDCCLTVKSFSRPPASNCSRPEDENNRRRFPGQVKKRSGSDIRINAKGVNRLKLAGQPEQARRLPQTTGESSQCPARLRTVAQVTNVHRML
jgi:hypothetical protein